MPRKPAKKTPRLTEADVKRGAMKVARLKGTAAEATVAAGFAAYDVVKAKVDKKRPVARKPSPVKTRTVQLAKNLTQAQAHAAAAKKSSSDFRGFIYDPKTGKAKLT